MGGHNAWRKRVQNGQLAKQGGGGNIIRHRPRFGRQGIIVVPKKGETNPKRKKCVKNADGHKDIGILVQDMNMGTSQDPPSWRIVLSPCWYYITIALVLLMGVLVMLWLFP